MRTLFITLASLAALASMNATADQALYMTCVACHGDKGQGNAALNAPALAGQQADYLVRQLKHFKSGARGGNNEDTLGAQMRAMANVLPGDDAIQKVSAYIAAMPATNATDAVQGDPEKGKQLFTSGCHSCHGSKGEGIAAVSAPRLAGLDAPYFTRQLELYKKGLRGKEGDSYGQQMLNMAPMIPSKGNVQDVIAYLRSVNQ